MIIAAPQSSDLSASRSPTRNTRPDQSLPAGARRPRTVLSKARSGSFASADDNAWREPEFIYNPAFAAPGADDEIMATPPSQPVDPAAWKVGAGMPAHLARLCERELLTPTQERDLFRRMNYARYRLAGLRQRLNLRKPSKRDLDLIEHYAAVALADRNRIVQSNLRLVVSIAKRFATPVDPFDELLSEGIATMMRAVDKFDYDRGFRFSTYATLAIRRTLSRLVTHNQRDRIRFALAETSQLEQAPSDDSGPAFSEHRWEELRGSLARLLNKLEPRERTIIRCRFGLDRTRQIRTLQSLAQEFGICKERVRQLEVRAMSKLRTLAEQASIGPGEAAIG